MTCSVKKGKKIASALIIVGAIENEKKEILKELYGSEHIQKKIDGV